MKESGYKPYPHTAVFAPHSMEKYKYVVIFSRFDGKWLFVRHKARATLETAGGHIEPGETPSEAAARELYEKTGAEKAELTPLFDYVSEDEDSAASGVVFFAEIKKLGELPDFEMAERFFFDKLPTEENWTYPAITPEFIGELKKMGYR